MKKKISLFLTITMLFSLAACGEGADVSDHPSPSASTGEQKDTQGSEPDKSEPDETEPSQTEPEEVEYVYTIRVVDVDGAPISGVFVQVCAGSSCVPAQTDADGVAGYPTEVTGDGELTAKIMLTTLEGYALVDGVEEISMADGNTDVVFVVEKIS